MNNTFRIKIGGFNQKHPHFYKLDRPNGVTNHLLLVIKSPAVFEVAGQTHEVVANEAILLSPDTPFHYHSPKGEYLNHWLHFDCEDVQQFQDYPLNTFIQLPDITRIDPFFQEIIWQYTYGDPTTKGDNCALLLQFLLNSLKIYAKNQPKKNNPHWQELLKLRIRLQNDPGNTMTVDAYAKEMGTSISHFQFLYKELFGVPFKTDLINMKIEYAKELLENTRATVIVIAEACGYQSDVHFYRQFKQIVGITPSKYRQAKQN